MFSLILQTYLKHVNRYIKDTADFLVKSSTTASPETIIATFEVENLYTNIPYDLVLEAMKYWLENYPKELPTKISKNFILKGIKFILENNYFNFVSTIHTFFKVMVQQWEQNLPLSMQHSFWLTLRKTTYQIGKRI